jgi:hypothetical protein
MSVTTSVASAVPGGRGGDAREVAAAVLAADWEPSTRACDLLLDGLALLTHEGYVAAAPALKVALRAFREERLSEEDELRWLWLACRTARALADDGAWDELTARHLELARLGRSIWVLAELIEAAVRSGQVERAIGPLAQLAELAHAAGTDWAWDPRARGGDARRGSHR